ncbi:hypothetical protein B0H19DRAFT_1146536 [Mycena capillaripes]|nr:hypothetical protein B0H19DRAFT_1146536 [Mycena capillaripes]
MTVFRRCGPILTSACGPSSCCAALLESWPRRTRKPHHCLTAPDTRCFNIRRRISGFRPSSYPRIHECVSASSPDSSFIDWVSQMRARSSSCGDLSAARGTRYYPQTARRAGLGSQAVRSHRSWKSRQDSGRLAFLAPSWSSSHTPRARMVSSRYLCLYLGHRGMSARVSCTRAYYGRWSLIKGVLEDIGYYGKTGGGTLARQA